MATVSRRGFLVLGGTGAAGVALAACGTERDPRAEGRDDELLAAALGAETALEAAYDALSVGADGAEALNRFRKASAARQSELGSLGATGSSATTPAPSGSDPHGFEATLSAANAAIAAYHEGAGLLSTTELRATATEYLVEVAAELATISGLFGADQVPEPFVTGGESKPHVAAESTTTTSTTSTSTTTTSTGAGG